MQNMLFKPSDYNQWIESAIHKLIITIDSCKTEKQLDVAKTMMDNFTLMLVLNDNYEEDDITFLSRQLYLYLQLKRNNLKL